VLRAAFMTSASGGVHAQDEAIQDSIPGQIEHLVEDILGALGIGEVGEAVVGARVAHAERGRAGGRATRGR
jgi:hypothetical protein